MFYRGDCEPSLELPEPIAQPYPRGTNVRCRCWIWWSMASSFLPLRLVLHIYAKYPNNWGWIRFLRQIATPSQRIILRYQTQSSPICFCNLSSWTLATFYSLESLHREYYASHRIISLRDNSKVLLRTFSHALQLPIRTLFLPRTFP